MIQAALWSKFPTAYVKRKIIPFLLDREIQVDILLSPKSSECDLSKIDVLLCMHEMAGHSEIERAFTLAKRYNKTALVLSRKRSHWDRDLKFFKQESTNMPALKKIPDDKLEVFLREYITLKNQNYSTAQMLPHLKHFYVDGSLTNSNQLSTYLYNLIKSGRAPNFFVEYMNRQKDLPRTARIKSSKRKDELQIAEELYREEIEKLQSQIAKIEQSHKEEVALLQKQGGDEKLHRIINALYESVKLGIVSEAEAFQKIVTYFGK